MQPVTWASIATRTPMGQQHYETEIQRALHTLAPDREFRSVRVTSLRNDLPGARRAPSGLTLRAPLPVALAIGAATYRTRGLVHRLDLRLPPHPGPEVVTAHDLPAAHFDDEGTLPPSLAAGARRSRVVIAPTVFAAAELREHLGVTRTVVIPYGLAAEYQDPQPASGDVLVDLGITGPYVLHAAGASKRKNLPALAAAWRTVAAERPDLLLVLCGPADPRRDTAFSGLPRVVMPGRLPSATVAGLMCRAAAVVVPSLYEGFGLPALEGMACGRPVVAARTSALPEVCADAALLVDPGAAGLADGLLRVLDDDELQTRLASAGPRRAAEFSWERAAQAHLDVYDAVSAG